MEAVEKQDHDDVQVGRRSPQLGNQLVTLLMACITALCMVFTIFYAYNNSRAQPYLSWFVSKRPEQSILILNVASHLTLFTLAELTVTVIDAARWSLACGASGTPALTWLTMSRATSFIGALYLSIGSGGAPGRLERNNHRIWGAQRYLF
jgi:hypothetical protein